MFRRKTLFVLGAGSSIEVGLPVGKDLATQIGKKMDIGYDGFNSAQVGDGDFQLFEQVTKNLRDNTQQFLAAAWLIRDGIVFSPSIDDFLDQHRTNKFVNHYGKAAIVKSILEAEQNSKLYFNPHKGQEMFDVSAIANTWFAKFMYMLGRGVPRENVREILDNVAFVVFNYDRCVEFFLVHALRRLYQISEGEAQDIVDNLHIFHPYGVLPESVRFGHGRADYSKMGESIKTYTEQIAAAEVIAEIAKEIEQASCIVFLGFAYHSQNLALLRPREPILQRSVFGTALGLSNSDVEIVSQNIAAMFKGSWDARMRKLIQLENSLKCADLFDDYARSLTGGD
jgi:hypothetical protein